jgi:pantothenate kinase
MTDPCLLTDPVGRIENLLNNSSTRILIGLSGLPGAGKSTYAEVLQRQADLRLGSGVLLTLGMDGFHLTKAALGRMADPATALARRGAPWTFDVEGLAQRLRMVKDYYKKSNVYWPDFQHGVGDPLADLHVVAPDVKVVMVEGLYMLYDKEGWQDVSCQFDERWYLDTPEETAYERLVTRHMISKNLTRSEAESRVDFNDKLNGALIFSTREQSDWRVQ